MRRVRSACLVGLIGLVGLLTACGPMYAEPRAQPAARPGAPAATAAPEAPAQGPAHAYPLLVAARDLDGVVVGDAPGQATIAIVFASWCGHCRAELAEIGALLEARAARRDVRAIGVNFRHHEEYDDRGDAAAVRAYVAGEAPWLRVVPADEAIFRALGAPAKVPTVYVYDAAGRLAAVYDRRERAMPDAAELGALLDAL